MGHSASFGEALRRHRLARRLTQAELAEAAGLSERAISDLERELKRPQRVTLRLLTDALELTASEAEEFEVVGRSPAAAPHAQDGQRPARHNLPSTRTSFVGRDNEMAKLQLLLAPATRLVTLTGAGGCGKTRLAVELARRVLPQFPHGTWFADLSSTADGALVPNVVLEAVGGRESSDQTAVESLLRQVDGQRALLVLDNCEHLVEACAQLVDRLLAATLELHVLATSREALRVPGEVAWRIPSLSTPGPTRVDDVERLAEYGAVQLFVDRMRQVDPNAELSSSNAGAVALICSRLDGIPLALELAAARTAAISVQDISTGLDDCFRLLASGSRTALVRQRTLRATIDWSHDLLSPAEQTLFRRLAIFAGGWTREAAAAVCEGEPVSRPEIFEVLLRLVDQSLVNVEVDDGRTRYRFLETVRAYAAERLNVSGDEAGVQAQHRSWCLDFAERAARGLRSPDQVTWYQRLTLEHDNIRAALDACRDEPAAAEVQLRLSAAMGQFWWPRKSGEGRRRLAEALERAPDQPSATRAAAFQWLAMFELHYGDPRVGEGLARACASDARAVGDTAAIIRASRVLAIANDQEDATARVNLLEEALELSRTSGLTGLQSHPMAQLAAMAIEAGQLGRAHTLADEADAIARAAGDVFSRAMTLSVLGWLSIEEGRLDDAESQFELLLQYGASWGGFHTPIGLVGLGCVSVRRGDLEQAREWYRRLLVDLRETSAESIILADALLHMASLDQTEGFHERAQRLAGANDAWHAAHGGTKSIWELVVRSPLLRGAVPVPPVPTGAELVRARAAGRSMSLDEAATHAIEPVDL